jgi:putative NADH-flavin reductase
MKIAVIGATGATGTKVVERALELGHEVIAVARRPELISAAARLTSRKGDVMDIDSVAKAIAGAEAVITCIGPTSTFAQGAGNSKGVLNAVAANLSPGSVMSLGIPNVLAACQRAGVKRLVMQSGIGLSDGKELSFSNRLTLSVHRRIFTKAVKDKAIAESEVQRSNLEWVIVRPPGMKEGPATRTYTAGPWARIAAFQQISFADCADSLVRAAASEPTWVRKIVNVGR